MRHIRLPLFAIASTIHLLVALFCLDWLPVVWESGVNIWVGSNVVNVQLVDIIPWLTTATLLPTAHLAVLTLGRHSTRLRPLVEVAHLLSAASWVWTSC